FRSLPIPSQETEEWRYTDLSSFDLDFRVAPPRHALTTSNQLLEGTGVIFCDLDRAAEEHPELLEPALHGLVPTDRTKFTALHGAFRAGGTFLYVPRDVRIELPLQSAMSLHDDGTAVFPHTVLVAEEGADVTLIDRYVSPDLPRAFSDAIAEIYLGDGAHVRYASIQEWGSGVTHLGIQRARVGRDAEFRSLAIGFGGALARAEAE